DFPTALLVGGGQLAIKVGPQLATVGQLSRVLEDHNAFDLHTFDWVALFIMYDAANRYALLHGDHELFGHLFALVPRHPLGQISIVLHRELYPATAITGHIKRHDPLVISRHGKGHARETDIHGHV